ncbi:class I SAM-dependent methyltransferase [Arthrobacter sp. CAN_C5]|uniref:class I SAM-dependent methyltransferase n=1 Tax=Arthrobacter sp. CAN_C5 TaxID=2760706 RepID=UPI001AE57B92|nr:methyltransferase domain-containing protein [Arthrobacter sp. CAN_C5]MBP2215906.1 ubiquinone/menaquinone biosynthesis C-methylase UbiE [Arthrobacter sp. CAN_C5]
MPPRHAEDVSETGAEDFERLAPALWNPMGNAVAAAADIDLGDRVLDVYCGSGASTIPAAQFAGPDSVVDALDPSSSLLDLARAKAEAMNLTQIRFDTAELAGWTAETPYDVVLCCYGLPRFPDMAVATTELAGVLRPGGRIALSTWDTGAHSEFRQILQEACSAEVPAEGEALLERELANMEQLASTERLGEWLLAHGFSTAGVDSVPLEVPLDADSAWSLVNGSLFRHLLPQDPTATQRIRSGFLDRLGTSYVLDARSLVAVAETAE